MDEHTLQIQQKRMQEYMEKKIKDRSKWDSKDSDSNDSDGSGKGWTFVKGSHNKKPLSRSNSKRSVRSGGSAVRNKGRNLITSEEKINPPQDRSPLHSLPNTIRDAFLMSTPPQKSPSPLDKSPELVPSVLPDSIRKYFSGKTIQEKATDCVNSVTKTSQSTPKNRPAPLKKPPCREDQGSLSDSSPTSRSPNGASFQRRISLDPNLRSPFMIVPGIYTEPRSIARKFGTVVNVMKKPGHHVGPAKNPDCLCDHCQSYWESVGGRNRTRSMGDPPSGKYVQNWKQFLEEQNAGSGNKQKKTSASDL